MTHSGRKFVNTIMESGVNVSHGINALNLTGISNDEKQPKRKGNTKTRWLRATIWKLGFELRTSGRAVSALNS
uniref:Uncharacterized protein n=1 Tax=Trichinella nativa TaxID=6335 RepID=A0A0V1KIY9_9BILA